MEGLQKIAVVTLVILIIAGAVVLVVSPERTTEIVITPGPKGNSNKFGIFGAVNEPGYYSSEKPLRIEEAVEIAGGLSENADEAHAHLAKWIEDGETVIIPTAGTDEPTLTPAADEFEKVDLNNASLKELMSLPGIGEKRAGDIIELREVKGGFSKKEDILEISGISEKLLESIYDLIIVR